MNLVYIKSYAHAESLGFKPFDGMISTVVDADVAPEVHIYAFEGSHTWPAGDKRIKMANMRTFEDKDGHKDYAANEDALAVLLDELYTKRPQLFEITHRPVSLGRRKKVKHTHAKRAAHSPSGMQRMG